MPEHTTTAWTCTRCGERVVKEGLDQPTTWSRIWYVTPPKGSVGDIGHSLGELCDPCGALLVSFMQGKDVDEETQAELRHLRTLVSVYEDSAKAAKAAG